MTARKTWKAEELSIAKQLGGARIPVTGIDRNGADIVTPLFHVQSKLRKSIPAWLGAWLGGIVSTTPDGKIGILVLRKPRQERKDALVVMRFGDFVELHGNPSAEDTCPAA